MFQIAFRFQHDAPESNEWKTGKFHPGFVNVEDALAYIETISSESNVFEYRPMYILPTRSR